MTSPTMRTISRLALGAALLVSAGCSTLEGLIPGREAASPVADPAPQIVAIAPGAPGDRPVWSSAAKTGAGES
jgi:glucoamylase